MLTDGIADIVSFKSAVLVCRVVLDCEASDTCRSPSDFRSQFSTGYIGETQISEVLVRTHGFTIRSDMLPNENMIGHISVNFMLLNVN